MTSISAPPFTDGRNEAYTAPARPRPLHDPLLRALEGVDMASLTGPLGERIEAAGATFSTEPLAVCPVPRLIENSEWTALSAALAQRVPRAVGVRHGRIRQTRDRGGRDRPRGGDRRCGGL